MQGYFRIIFASRFVRSSRLVYNKKSSFRALFDDCNLINNEETLILFGSIFLDRKRF